MTLLGISQHFRPQPKGTLFITLHHFLMNKEHQHKVQIVSAQQLRRAEKFFVFSNFLSCSILSDYEHGEKFYPAYNEAISNAHKKDGGSHMAREVETMLLPQKGVLFLGGHQNMTKKLRQQFPKWTYVTDDQIRRCTSVNQTVVFYWTKHSSHKMMQYVYSKLSEDTNIIYVSATNISLLIEQMQNTYQQVVS